MRNLGAQKEKKFLKRFIIEFIQYKDYIITYSKALQEHRVTNTALGMLWWFLDPLLNMGIYIILVRLIFNQRDPNFPVFFFSAMLVWRYFSTSVLESISSISNNINICRSVYIPKFIFPLVTTWSGVYPLMVSLGLLSLLMIALKISFSIYLLYLPLLLIILLILTITCSMIVAHIGVFFKDFANILNHFMTVIMFATPIFYNIEKVPPKYQFIIKLNPIGTMTTSFRNIFTYGTPPPTKQLIYLFIITSIFFIFSIRLLYKYDKVYNKVNP